MKVIIFIVSSLWVISSWATGPEKTNVQVKGMVCSFCAQGIEKKFKAFKEVQSVNVDLDKKVVHLEWSPGKKIDDETIKKTIQNAGYDVVRIEKVEP